MSFFMSSRNDQSEARNSEVTTSHERPCPKLSKHYILNRPLALPLQTVWVECPWPVLQHFQYLKFPSTSTATIETSKSETAWNALFWIVLLEDVVFTRDWMTLHRMFSALLRAQRAYGMGLDECLGLKFNFWSA
jgi:hypothetical protein